MLTAVAVAQPCGITAVHLTALTAAGAALAAHAEARWVQQWEGAMGDACG